MENEMMKEKTWIAFSDGFDIYEMVCPFDCGCTVLCTQNIYDGSETADCPLCGDITMTAWDKGVSD